jgi:hypothetical protein
MTTRSRRKQRGLEEPASAEMAQKQMRELRDREDENEIEKELHVGDAIGVFGPPAEETWELDFSQPLPVGE